MTKKVWLCAVHNDEKAQSNFLFYRYEDWTTSETLEAEVKVFNATVKRIREGEAVPIEVLPTRLTLVDRAKNASRQLPPVCANTFLLLRRDIADIFKRHDLGDTRLLPLDLYDIDMTTKLPEQLFALVPGGSQKTIDLAENNSGLQFVHFSDPPKYFLGAPNDDLTNLRAVDMPDDNIACWIDGAVPYAVFLSDALVSDLATAGLDQAFCLYSIRGC